MRLHDEPLRRRRLRPIRQRLSRLAELGRSADATFFVEELGFVTVTPPKPDTEVFEWVDLLEAVLGADVFEQAAPEVDAKVRRVHIGTHGSDVEARLRRLFGSWGWTNLNDYGAGTVAETPWGTMRFQDGVQTWVNRGAA